MKSSILMIFALLISGIIMMTPSDKNFYFNQDPLILSQDSVFNIQNSKKEFKNYLILHYKDTLTSKIYPKAGPPVDSYCTDSTLLTFTFKNSKEPDLKIWSVKKMSCLIVDTFEKDYINSSKLKKIPVDSIYVFNQITYNKYGFKVKNPYYFRMIEL